MGGSFLFHTAAHLAAPCRCGEPPARQPSHRPAAGRPGPPRRPPGPARGSGRPLPSRRRGTSPPTAAAAAQWWRGDQSSGDTLFMVWPENGDPIPPRVLFWPDPEAFSRGGHAFVLREPPREGRASRHGPSTHTFKVLQSFCWKSPRAIPPSLKRGAPQNKGMRRGRSEPPPTKMWR